MKYYIIKYALTKGIYEAEGTESVKKDYMKTKGHYNLLFSKDYSDSLEDAKIMADTMRMKKIAALEKQIEKLKNMTF